MHTQIDSHELAEQLLAQPKGKLVIQAGHAMREGDCADTVLDLSPNLDGELCLEVGQAEVIDTWQST